MKSRIAGAIVVGAFMFYGAPAFAADTMSSGSMAGPQSQDSSMASDHMASDNMASKVSTGHMAKAKHHKKMASSSMKQGDSMHTNSMGSDLSPAGSMGSSTNNAMSSGH